jgi:hypothetical protein
VTTVKDNPKNKSSELLGYRERLEKMEQKILKYFEGDFNFK